MTVYDYPAFLKAVARHRGRECWVHGLLLERQRRMMRAEWPSELPQWMRETALRQCDGELDAHHLVSKQRIKRHYASAHLVLAELPTAADALMDPRNGIPTCRRHHDLLERRLIVPLRDELPEDAVEFAREVGLEWSVERDYPVAA